MRPGELLNSIWLDVDFEKQTDGVCQRKTPAQLGNGILRTLPELYLC
jgi:hypothetical protein